MFVDLFWRNSSIPKLNSKTGSIDFQNERSLFEKGKAYVIRSLQVKFQFLFESLTRILDNSNRVSHSYITDHSRVCEFVDTWLQPG